MDGFIALYGIDNSRKVIAEALGQFQADLRLRPRTADLRAPKVQSLAHSITHLPDGSYETGGTGNPGAGRACA
jgi:hypothetical protein